MLFVMPVHPPNPLVSRTLPRKLSFRGKYALKLDIFHKNCSIVPKNLGWA